jgi:uncharacterized membrane protein
LVSSRRSASELVIVVRPNHSSSWRSNQLVILLVAVPSLGAAIGFTALGAWPVLPFAGAELAALAAALYYVNWKLEYRHVITLSDDSVCIDKGHYLPRRHWRFDRHQAALAVTPEQHPWEGPRIAVHGQQESVAVGDFLNRDDCLSLLSILRSELLVRSHAPRSQLKA